MPSDYKRPESLKDADSRPMPPDGKPGGGQAFSPLIRLEGLFKSFPISAGLLNAKKHLRAVNGVSFSVPPGQTLGLVGESGCGKSTVGNMILRLLKPDGGRIFFKERDMAELATKREHRAELARIQAVFQDPQSSLDPRMTVEKIVGYPLLPFLKLPKGERTERVLEILAEVGLGPEHLRRFPHEFSGGQRQRIGIARALVVKPEFIVFDEPTSALDVSVQAQILHLIKGLQARHNYSYLFISHDLAVIRHLSHRVAVMYLGRLVESGAREEVFEAPKHPYTRLLLDSAPEPDPECPKPWGRQIGDVPSPINPPPGCTFHPRCPEAMPVCRRAAPLPCDTGGGHLVECFLYQG